jgi:uncharacterized protein YbaP (TraB family)
MTTTPKSTITGPTRREVLMSLGTVAIGIAAGATRSAPHSAWPVWSVEGAGSQGYLVGETYPRPADWHDRRIEALVPGCSILWTETNQIIRGDLNELVTRNGIDNVTRLMARLDADDRARLEKAAALCKVPMASLKAFRPWLAGATLEDTFYQAMGLSGLAPDKVLSAKAQAAGVPLFSEFAVKDDVVTWFGSMSSAQDLQFLRYILAEVLASPSAQAATFTDWRRGDFRRATGIVTPIKQLYPELYEILVLDRNRKWVPRFKNMLSGKRPAMVVLGHFHLVGSDSALAHLEAAGMTVRRI